MAADVTLVASGVGKGCNEADIKDFLIGKVTKCEMTRRCSNWKVLVYLQWKKLETLLRMERLQKLLLTKMINSNALKNIELLKALTKVDFCRAVWHSATYHFSFCTKSKSRAALLQRRLLANSVRN